MNLSEKVIVITGASKGLGRETALHLCRQNPYLVLVARTGSMLEHTQKEIENLTGRRPLTIPCDISIESDVKRMAEVINGRFDHIDVLINNAGIAIHKVSELMSGEEMRKQFEVNFYGQFYCIKALLPLLRAGSSAYILNIASLVSKVSFAENSVYSATKSALEVFSSGLLCEMKEFNINVGLFLPGLMNTTFQNDREHKIKAPAFMILNPGKAAIELEKMIIKRKAKVYMYRWMLLPMKMRQLFS